MNPYTSLRKNPFVRILIPFVIGILTAFQYNEFLLKYLFPLTVVTLVAITICIILIFLKSQLKLTDFFIHTTVFVFSIALTLLNISTGKQRGKEQVIFGKVLQPPVSKKNSMLIRVEQINEGKPSLFKPGICIYTHKGIAAIEKIKPGSIIAFKGLLQEIHNNGNPDEFNYQVYMASVGYFYQAYVAANEIQVANKQENTFSVIRIGYDIRNYVMKSLDNHIQNKETHQLISALVIGDRAEIGDERMQDYTNAGVVHVLAISGLHVGIIYLILNTLLKSFGRNLFLKVLRLILVLFVIWAYALLTGFSPSVTRAATMFSLFAIGKLFQREISIFNLIAASALFSLIVYPLIIFNPGFQLSYSAVSGIVYFQPIFKKWFIPQNKIIEYIYNLVTVTISAQLATAPIAIYYFNQFPTYFWLANMLVIPLVFLLVVISILFLCTSGIAFLNFALVSVLNLLAEGLNQWVSFINTLPHAVIQHLRLNLPEAVLALLVAWLLFTWLKNRRAIFVILSLLSACLFLLTGIAEGIKNSSTEKFIIYNTRSRLDIGFYSRERNVLLTTSEDPDSVIWENEYYLKHWSGMGKIDDVRVRLLNKCAYSADFDRKRRIGPTPFIKLENKKGFLIFGRGSEKIIDQCNTDELAIIVGQNWYPPHVTVHCNTIIVPSNIKPYFARQWSDYAKIHNIRYYNIKKQGAYVFNFTGIQ
jgi:competence protein ComEC